MNDHISFGVISKIDNTPIGFYKSKEGLTIDIGPSENSISTTLTVEQVLFIRNNIDNYLRYHTS